MRLSEYEIRRIRHMRRNGVPAMKIHALTGHSLNVIVRYPTPNVSKSANWRKPCLVYDDADLVAEAAFRAEREHMEVSHR